MKAEGWGSVEREGPEMEQHGKVKPLGSGYQMGSNSHDRLSREAPPFFI